MNKYISKSLAQSIHEKAKKKNIQFPMGEHCWVESNKWTLEESKHGWFNAIPAFDCIELGEILPADTKYEGYQVRTHDHLEFANSEPEARGKMLLYLIENDLL